MGFLDTDGVVQKSGDENLEPTGFPNRTDSTVSLDDTTTPGDFTVSISPAITSFYFHIQGRKFTKTTTQSATVNSAATGGYFVYFDTTGTLVATTTFWDLEATAPVAYVYYNSTLQRAIIFEERHGNVMSAATHTNLHLTRGTKIESGGVIGSATYAVDTATDAANSWGMSSASIWDEDINTVTEELVEPTVFTPGTENYTILYRSGAGGDWTWETSEVPFLYTTSSYAEYNEYTGATWQMTTMANNSYGKYFVYVVPALTAAHQIIIVPAQEEFANEAEADAYTFTSLDLDPSFPFQEVVGLYEVVIVVKNSDTNLGKAETVSVKRNIQGKVSILGGTIATIAHNDTTGKQGGTTAEYYHLTSAEHTEVTTFFGATDIAGAEAEALTDGSNADSLHIHTKTYDISGAISNKPTNGQEIFRFVSVRSFEIPSDFSNSQAKAGTAATGSSVFSVKRNGSQVAQFTFAGAATSATFTTQAAVSFAAGDILTIEAPATADSTLADIAWTFYGSEI